MRFEKGIGRSFAVAQKCRRTMTKNNSQFVSPSARSIMGHAPLFPPLFPLPRVSASKTKERAVLVLIFFLVLVLIIIVVLQSIVVILIRLFFFVLCIRLLVVTILRLLLL